MLPVVVKGKHDRYVADLPRERFVVYDNARRVAVELFSNEDTPVTVGLIIDASGSMRSKLGEVIAASLAFVKSSNPQDDIFAIRFNDDVKPVVQDRPFLMAGDLTAKDKADFQKFIDFSVQTGTLPEKVDVTKYIQTF